MSPEILEQPGRERVRQDPLLERLRAAREEYYAAILACYLSEYIIPEEDLERVKANLFQQMDVIGVTFRNDVSGAVHGLLSERGYKYIGNPDVSSSASGDADEISLQGKNLEVELVKGEDTLEAVLQSRLGRCVPLSGSAKQGRTIIQSYAGMVYNMRQAGRQGSPEMEELYCNQQDGFRRSLLDFLQSMESRGVAGENICSFDETGSAGTVFFTHSGVLYRIAVARQGELPKIRAILRNAYYQEVPIPKGLDRLDDRFIDGV